MSAKTKELAQTGQQNISEVLVISEARPTDLIANPTYLDGIKKAIEVTSNLVYELTDEGFKEAKDQAANTRKFIKIWNDHRIAAVKEANAETNQWDTQVKVLLKQLGENPERDLKQFEERQQEKLNLIQALAVDLLKIYRAEIGVKPEFMSGVDFSPIMKLSGSLTDGGKLTAKAQGFIKTLATNDLSAQNKVENRRMLIEVRCLRDDIRPALTEAHFGAVFYADDAEFNVKLDELVAIEIERRAEMEARIKKQQEAENQRKIDEALKAQQAEANRLAAAQARKEAEAAQAERQRLLDEQAKAAVIEHRRAEHSFVDQAVTTAQQVDNEIHAKRLREDDRKNPPVTPAPVVRAGKRAVRFTVDFVDIDAKAQLPDDLQKIFKEATLSIVFEVSVPSHITNKGVEDHFCTKVPKSILALVKSIRFE